MWGEAGWVGGDSFANALAASEPVARVGRVCSASCLGPGNPDHAAESHSLLEGT